MMSPEVMIPRSFFVPASVTGQATEPAQRHLLDSPHDALARGDGDDVAGCNRHHLAFLLSDMGLELNRATVKLALHFEEPVATLYNPVILVHYHPPLYGKHGIIPVGPKSPCS